MVKNSEFMDSLNFSTKLLVWNMSHNSTTCFYWFLWFAFSGQSFG